MRSIERAISRRRAASAPRPPGKERASERLSEQRASNRQVVATRLEGTAASAVVALLFDPDSLYGVAADDLLGRVPWHRRKGRGHWICEFLDDSSKAIDPGTYTAAVGHEVTQMLREGGMPRFAAVVLGKSAAFGAGRLIEISTGQIMMGLRVIVPLVCPDFERCPAQDTVCTSLLKPGVEAMLREGHSGSDLRSW
ncbi:MAG: hypothetical protein ACRDPS_23475 [Nocardioides sp.]|uniref:hypothetical protein n=1 Tax=Nocardioides sp. TaxID=35761 RepID=UPI003D6BF933